MSEILHFLMPLNGQPATKTFEYKEGVWSKISDYDIGKYFKGYEIPVENLIRVYDILIENQNFDVFLVHGGFIPGTNLNRMVRRKREDGEDGEIPTIKNRAVHLVCIDVDGYENDSIESFIRHLPIEFHEASYICQHSASYKLTSNKLKCHLFFWLEKAVELDALRKWALTYNKEKQWGNIIDSKVYSGNQPIYTQRRTCLGAVDPITPNQFIKLVIKKGMVKGQPIIIKENQPPACGNGIEKSREKYNLKAGVEKILKSEDFHSELNSMALSLLNKKVPAKVVKDMLKGAMNVAKSSSDPSRWQTRFDDIDRTVESAAAIVDNPTIEDLFDWIESVSSKEIRINFVKKSLKLNPVELKLFVEKVNEKTSYGKQPISAMIREGQKVEQKKQKTKRQEQMTTLRFAHGVEEIEVENWHTSEATKKCGKILAQSKNGAEVFHYAGTLASVGIGAPSTIRQAEGSAELGENYPEMPIIISYKKPYHSLAGRLENDVVFKNGAGREIECPQRVLHVLGDAYDRSFRPLVGVVENPFVDSDWQIIQDSGYSKRTGLFSVLKKKEKIKIIDPKKAYDYLAHTVFDEFPFKSDLDRVVAVAALLTVAQRPTLAGDEAGIPGFGIVSPIQSSGKTTLAQLISYSVFGRPIAASNFSNDEVELEKHVLAILREGHSCVLFDNIDQATEVKSSVLSRAMSTDLFAGRQLGENKTIQVPSSVIWMFTGNNISFVGDFATRVYPIFINPNLANPEDRVFKRGDLGKWVISNKQKIMSAILSIVLAGKERIKIKNSSRFKSWDKFIRKPLFLITGVDVNETIVNNKKNDSVFTVKKQLIMSIYEAFGSKFITVKQIIDKAFGGFDKGGVKNGLAQCLEDVVMKKAQNSLSVARYLRGMVGIVFGDYVLEKRVSTINYWRVKKG